MGESCCGKSCLFAELRGTLDFGKISCFLNLSFECSAYMVLYESLFLLLLVLLVAAGVTCFAGAASAT